MIKPGKTAEELRRDARFCARQALDLRHTADNLCKRAAALEHLSEGLVKRSERIAATAKKSKARR